MTRDALSKSCSVSLSETELELLLRALTIPECWNPTLRDEAAAIVERVLAAQQSLFASAP